LEFPKQAIQIGGLAVARFQHQRKPFDSQIRLGPALVIQALGLSVKVAAHCETLLVVDFAGNPVWLGKRVRVKTQNEYHDRQPSSGCKAYEPTRIAMHRPHHGGANQPGHKHKENVLFINLFLVTVLA
jgi:hypothetical protein